MVDFQTSRRKIASGDSPRAGQGRNLETKSCEQVSMFLTTDAPVQQREKAIVLRDREEILRSRA